MTNYGRQWWNRLSATFGSIGPPKLVPPKDPTITWRVDEAGARTSADGYWAIRRVVTFELQRQGVVIGIYDDEEQAAARAEIDNATREICPGSEQDPWRSQFFGEKLGRHGECQVCGGWWQMRGDGMLVVHPAKPAYRRNR